LIKFGKVTHISAPKLRGHWNYY